MAIPDYSSGTRIWFTLTPGPGPDHVISRAASPPEGINYAHRRRPWPRPRDRIITHRDEVFVKYGFALYTVAALSALMEPTDEICPNVDVRKKDEGPIEELLAPMPNVDLTGIRSDTDRGDIVELAHEDQNRRIERQTCSGNTKQQREHDRLVVYQQHR